MTRARSATLEERAAFLLALFAHNQAFHGSYVVEKLEIAFAEGVKPATLEAMLDHANRKRFRAALDSHTRDASVWAWARAWEGELRMSDPSERFGERLDCGCELAQGTWFYCAEHQPRPATPWECIRHVNCGGGQHDVSCPRSQPPPL